MILLHLCILAFGPLKMRTRSDIKQFCVQPMLFSPKKTWNFLGRWGRNYYCFWAVVQLLSCNGKESCVMQCIKLIIFAPIKRKNYPNITHIAKQA